MRSQCVKRAWADWPDGVPGLYSPTIGYDWFGGQQLAELGQVRQAEDSGDAVVQRTAGRTAGHARQAFELLMGHLVEQPRQALEL